LYLIITLGVVVLVALSYYAGTLLWRVKQQEKAVEEEQTKRLNYITDSICHIAKAMKAEQCEPSEGVLRIWVLLEHYNKAQAEPKDYVELYSGYSALYSEIKDMPTHDARKKFSKKDILKLDLQRMEAEQKYAEQIVLDTSQLILEFTLSK
jgi:hypothetical protein